ncbi:MAG: OmpH family outer membrane protein [Polyangiales bacterium]
MPVRIAPRFVRPLLVASLAFSGVAGAALIVDPIALADALPHPWTLRSVQGASSMATRLGMDDDQALSTLLSAVTNGSTYLPIDLAPFRRDAAARVRFVNDVGPVAKRILASDVFRRVYADYRADRIASATPEPQQSMAQMRQQQITQMQASIADLQQNMQNPQLSRDVRNQLQGVLRQMQGQLRDLQRQANDPATQAQDRQQDETMARYREQAVTEALAQIDRDVPADPNQLIMRRLEDYLALTANMPWNAQLQLQYGMQRFVDPTLEQKDGFWKMNFRAGREAVEAARTFATSWLAELRAAPPTTVDAGVGAADAGTPSTPTTPARRGRRPH